MEIIEEEKIKIYFDDCEYSVPKSISVLEAARMVQIEIPSLCYLKDINEIGACRVCLVEIEGVRSLQASCVYPVSDGLKVITNSERIRRARKTAVTLLLSNHHRECLTCIRNLNCELQNLAERLGIRDIPYTGEMADYGFFDDNPAIQRDYNKCINCRRCESICNIQACHVYSPINRGIDTIIAPAFKNDLSEVNCIMCGQCVLACPTASLAEKENIVDVWNALADKTKHVVVQTAPSIQVTIGEEFGMKTGTLVKGKLVTALKKIGFAKVFATDVTADLTIMEEAHELLERMKTPESLPLLSSCCPAWVKYAEHNYPELLPNLSSCKSPHQMCGALTKTWYAKKYGLDPKNIITVAVMPCTAKKYEASRPEMRVDGIQSVDFVLTTRETARMIRQAGIDFVNLEDSHYDEPFDQFSSAGTIFGATGGLFEAALRTAHYLITGEDANIPDYSDTRSKSGIKYGQFIIGDQKLSIAVVHGTGNAQKAIGDHISGKKKIDYMEVMACPGGCIGGGGQPILNGKDHKKISLDYRYNRADALFNIDRNSPLRHSYKNERIQLIYKEFLGEPMSDTAKKYLHTTYVAREKYPFLILEK